MYRWRQHLMPRTRQIHREFEVLCSAHLRKPSLLAFHLEVELEFRSDGVVLGTRTNTVIQIEKMKSHLFYQKMSLFWLFGLPVKTGFANWVLH